MKDTNTSIWLVLAVLIIVAFIGLLLMYWQVLLVFVILFLFGLHYIKKKTKEWLKKKRDAWRKFHEK